jgi:hypothetical protein
MPLHLVKLSVGAEGFDDHARWAKKRAAVNAKGRFGKVHDHVTRMFPRRAVEILGGGSIYWVIKGAIFCRQRVVGLEPVTGEDGVDRCAILLDPHLIATEAQPRRAFQGWRYLKEEDAPRDLKKGVSRAGAALTAELAELGLL